MADDTVHSERVSGPHSLFSRENTGKFANLRLESRKHVRKYAVITEDYRGIPYLQEQGIFSVEQGNIFAKQGFWSLDEGLQVPDVPFALSHGWLTAAIVRSPRPDYRWSELCHLPDQSCWTPQAADDYGNAYAANPSSSVPVLEENAVTLRRTILRLFLATAVTISAISPVAAQTDWPKGPVKVIVPFPPGGANDTVARPYADALSKMLSQPFVVENRGGAGGAVGIETLIRSKPDGYTLCMCASTVISTVSNLRKVSYQATDVDAIAITTMYISGLMLGPKNPATNFKEFLAYARANPGKVTYGGSGVGSPTEFRMKYLANIEKLDMVSVPYNGNAPALNDLLAGTIDGIIELNGFPHVKAGKLRMIALFAEKRHPEFPDVPTINELGYPQINTPIWQGFYGPNGIPEPIRQKLNSAIAEINQDKDLQARLLAMGFATRSLSLEETRKFYLEDDALYKKIIREAKISVDQ